MLVCETAKGALGGAITGALGGTVTGACIGLAGGGMPAPATIGLGALGGAVGGAALGAAAGAGLALREIRPVYNNWYNLETKKTFIQGLMTILNPTGNLDNFICPIFKTPVIDGVYTPSGHLYEREAIVQSVKRYGRDPKTNENLSVNELIPAEKESRESCKAFANFLISKRDETLEAAPELLESYDQLTNDICDALYLKGKIALSKLERELERGKITVVQAMKQRQEIANLYSI